MRSEFSKEDLSFFDWLLDGNYTLFYSSERDAITVDVSSIANN